MTPTALAVQQTVDRTPVGPSVGLFNVAGERFVTPPIRGRTAELKLIGAMVAALAQGRGGVLVIEGPPGIGKSRLLTEVMALADKAGVRALFGEAFEYQQAVPFFSLFMATLRADPPVGDVEALRRLGGSADLRYWVVRDLADAIHTAAAQTPLVIVLEDIHWADTGTLLALRSLAGAQPELPVLWVLTARTGAGGPAVRETLTVLQRANATVVRIGAISPDAVSDMVQDSVRANADASLLTLAAKARGNPFLVSELVCGLDEEGRLTVSGGRAAAAGDELPRRLAATMQQRLDLLSDDAGELVRIAALLPDRFSASLLSAVVDRPPSSLMSAIEEVVRADLLVEDGERLRFRHDLLREATRQSIPQSLRRAMERQSASIMLTMGVAPAEVANQLARSAEPGDAEAVSALRQAARSVGQCDPSAAADYSKRALELLPADDADHGSLVADTVALLNGASRYQEAEELAAAALVQTASTHDEAEIRLRRSAVTKHCTQQRVEENRRALQLRDIGDVIRARHLAWLAYNLLYDQSDHQRAAADEAAAAAAATGDVEARILADVTLACLEGGDGYVGRALQRIEEAYAVARASDATAAHLVAASNYANLLAVHGRLGDAKAVVARGAERAQREGSAMAHAVWATFGGLVDLAAGGLSEARVAIESMPRSEPAASTELDMVCTMILAEVAMRTDDRKLLQQMVNYAREAYLSGSAKVQRGAAYVLALVAWHRDDIDEATRWLSGDMPVLGVPLVPQTLDRVILSARVASAAGDAGLRAAVLRATEVLERERPAVRLVTGVAGYARGILNNDASGLVAAAELLESSSRPLLYAAAAEDAGAGLARGDCGDAAIAQLNAAFDAYLGHGALADARRVSRDLRRLGVEHRVVSPRRAKSGWDSLTDSELKVVSVIAHGATNRDVATRLHLSVHTVKTHVHNAFAKLGISSREQLARAVREAG
jgi:DNA-binding CsgD family transcriptional regulator